MIAGGVLARADWRSANRRVASERGERSPLRRGPDRVRTRRPIPLVWLPRVLAAVVVLYAIQTLYSPDFSKSLQNVCFFFVPFSLVYALLRDVSGTAGC